LQSAVLSLILFAILSFSSALSISPTADQKVQLVAGYSYLKWGDYRINPEHPPFVKLSAVLALLDLDINGAPLPREARDQVQVNGKYGWLGEPLELGAAILSNLGASCRLAALLSKSCQRMTDFAVKPRFFS
jgi:hypothetical protein